MKHDRSIALTLQGDVTVGNWIRQLLRSTQSLVFRGDGSTMKKVVNSMDCKILELEHLVLRNLQELKAIIDGTIPDESNSFQKLESLNLRNLPKLVHLWSSLNQNVSGGNLKSISIVNLDMSYQRQQYVVFYNFNTLKFFIVTRLTTVVE